MLIYLVSLMLLLNGLIFLELHLTNKSSIYFESKYDFLDSNLSAKFEEKKKLSENTVYLCDFIKSVAFRLPFHKWNSIISFSLGVFFIVFPSVVSTSVVDARIHSVSTQFYASNFLRLTNSALLDNNAYDRYGTTLASSELTGTEDVYLKYSDLEKLSDSASYRQDLFTSSSTDLPNVYKNKFKVVFSDCTEVELHTILTNYKLFNCTFLTDQTFYILVPHS